MHDMKYKSGYKYQLSADESIDTSIIGYDIDLPFIRLTQTGRLMGRLGYAWDGPSGPTIDDETNMRSSLFHDILYQLIRMGLLPFSVKKTADKLLQEISISDGMWKIRAWAWFKAMGTWFAKQAATVAKKTYKIRIKKTNFSYVK